MAYDLFKLAKRELTSRIKPKWVGTASEPVDELHAQTASIDSLVDANDDAAWETLRELGYESGDVLCLATIANTASGGSKSTTSTSFTSNTSLFDAWLRLDEIVPSGLTAKVAVGTQINSDAGETGTVRIQEATNGETVVSVAHTGTFGRVTSGYQTFNATAADAVVQWRAEIKTTDGTDGSSFWPLTVKIGVQL